MKMKSTIFQFQEFHGNDSRFVLFSQQHLLHQAERVYGLSDGGCFIEFGQAKKTTFSTFNEE